MRKQSDSKPIWNKTYLKTKIKPYGEEAADFHDKEMSEVGCNHTFLAVTIIDFVVKKDRKYCPQVLWEEYKYNESKEKWLDHNHKNRKIVWKHDLNTKYLKTLGIIIYKYKVWSVLNGMNYLKLIFKLFCIR